MSKAFICACLVALSSMAAARPQHGRGPLMPILELQVLLDRAGFSPGEIDGQLGANTLRAMSAFQRAQGLPESGPEDSTLRQAVGAGSTPVLTTYTVTPEDAKGPFRPDLPEDMMAKGKLEALPYASLIEALAEQFHVAPEVLQQLNAGTKFEAGASIRVPNVAGQAGAPPEAARIVVSRGGSSATVFDAAGKLLFHAPVTSGSEFDPLPLGEWAVTAVVKNPTFNYNPDLFWDADPRHAKTKIPPGPNGPVGVVWIGLTKEHYGLHGTPEPGKVGHTMSHGCVRLTNWDVSKIAAMVRKGTPVIFTE